MLDLGYNHWGYILSNLPSLNSVDRGAFQRKGEGSGVKWTLTILTIQGHITRRCVKEEEKM